MDRRIGPLSSRLREALALLALGLASACLTDPAQYGPTTSSDASSASGESSSSAGGASGSSGSPTSTSGSVGDTTSTDASSTDASSSGDSSSGDSSSSAGGGGAGGGLPTTMPAKVYGVRFGDMKHQELRALVSDPDGNVYMAGSWTGTFNFGSVSWLHGCTGLNLQHAFVAKLEPINGTPLWAECLNTTGTATAIAIAYVAGDSVVVGGSFSGTLSGYLPGDVTSQGGTDGFVVKLAADGTRMSVATVGGSSDDAVTGVFATSSDIFATGTFQGTASFGGIQRSASSGDDLFLARIGASGFAYANVFQETATSPTVHLSGDATQLQLAGSFDGSLDFGGSTTGLVSSGGQDGFLATFDLAGGATYSAAFGGTGDDVARAIAVGSNAIAIGGEFASALDLDGAGGQAGLVASDTPDAFLALVKASHSVVRQRRFGAPQPQRTLGVASRGGGVLAGGSFRGTVDFGGVQLTSPDEDGFAVKADSLGQLDWVFQLGNDTGIQRVVAADRTGGIAGGFNVFGGNMYSGFSVYGQFLGTTGTTNPDIFVVAFED